MLLGRCTLATCVATRDTTLATAARGRPLTQRLLDVVVDNSSMASSLLVATLLCTAKAILPYGHAFNFPDDFTPSQ